MKKILIFIFILVLILLGYVFLSSRTVEAPKMDEQIKQDEEVKVLSFSSSTKEIVKDHYGVKFDFPVVDNPKISTEINKVVEEMVSDFEKDAIEFGPFPGGADRPYTLFASFEDHLDQRYDSFVFLISVDFGGAHPNHYYKTLSFDKDGNLISIEEFLKREFAGKNVVGKISEIVKKQITEKLADNANLEMIEQGAGPDVNNFRNFYVVGDEIVFLFEPYAVAPYAYSSQEARIKFSELN